jgi:hypothetical protein
MNKNTGYHVTVVDNKTGETIRDFKTRAIVYVMINEIDEDKVNEEYGGDMSCGVGTSKCIDRVRHHEMLGITSGLQMLLQAITEEHPELELLSLLCDQRTIRRGDKAEKEVTPTE